MLSSTVRQKIEQAQVNELTESIIYRRLAAKIKDKHNRAVLERIAGDEERHARFWQKITKKEVFPDKFKIFFYTFLARFLGMVFGLKLMERGEDMAQETYAAIAREFPSATRIKKDEQEHEKIVIGMIKEERLDYVGSIVLGLNDALVELTGALAGLTLALGDTQLIALVGLITGIAASFSMAASEYLSQKEEHAKHPLKASTYTGIAYICTVFFLILPYLILSNPFVALGATLFVAILIIFLFTFYTAIANDLGFKGRFFRMVAISMGVALLSFLVGSIIKGFFGIDA